MTTRRTFIKTTFAGMAGVLLLKNYSCTSGNDELKFGYISGIVGDEMKEDWKSVLSKTVEYGFSEIEIGSPPEGVPVPEFIEFCRKTGIKPVAGGVPMTEDMDQLREKLDVLKAMDIKYAVSYWPWFVGEPFSLEDCKKSADALNQMGKVCNENGLILCWHNHDHEFDEMEEGLPFDYLMQNTDANLVKCELDVYWAAKGGADPVALMQKYPGRYGVLHLKDMTGDEERTFECVGRGIIDFPAILKEARRQGIKHFMVEHDKVKDGMACLKSSGAYLSNI